MDMSNKSGGREGERDVRRYGLISRIDKIG